MRVLALSSMFGVLALAGLALAQEGLIVDPWAKPPAAVDRAGSRSVADGAVLPPLSPERTPLWSEGWSDPPANSSPKGAIPRPVRHDRPALPVAAAPPGGAAIAWAQPVAMIVDPWQPSPRIAVKRDFAIVDPWLR